MGYASIFESVVLSHAGDVLPFMEYPCEMITGNDRRVDNTKPIKISLCRVFMLVYLRQNIIKKKDKKERRELLSGMRLC